MVDGIVDHAEGARVAAGAVGVENGSGGTHHTVLTVPDGATQGTGSTHSSSILEGGSGRASAVVCVGVPRIGSRAGNTHTGDGVEEGSSSSTKTLGGGGIEGESDRAASAQLGGHIVVEVGGA